MSSTHHVEAKDFFDLAMAFHGHKCPAMPLGLRAGAAAMNALGVERSQDKELMLLVETSDDHAAGCFADGLMAVTGCTYGKSNIKKTYYGKMAFTLIDTRRNRAVKVQLKPEFFGKMLNSPFVQQRKRFAPLTFTGFRSWRRSSTVSHCSSSPRGLWSRQASG